MIRPGLVSITFRALPPLAVARLAVRTGLAGIEWGGDVHAPHGDERAAKAVATITADEGLAVAAYGSYYRVGHAGEDDVPDFPAVLASAVVLGAPTVRVWAGRQGSADAGAGYWDRVVSDSRRIGAAAAAAGVTLSYEYHRNTLTDTNESARRLLREVDHPAVGTLWQPYVPDTVANNLAGLSGVLPWVRNLHVFAWAPDRSRLPLADGRDEWARYVAAAAALDPGQEHWALLEFVRGDDPDQLPADAGTLRELLAAAGQPPGPAEPTG